MATYYYNRLFYTCLLSTDCVLGTVFGQENIEMNEIMRILLLRAYFR